MKPSHNCSHISRQRLLLLGSAATAAILSMPALAADGPSGEWLAPQAGTDASDVFQSTYRRITMPDVAPAPQIVIADPGDSDTSLDPEDVNGVGQMIVDNGDGSIGLCTGSLINPRTVIFAAHCVNGRAASDYGAGAGGVPIGFGFSNDTYPGLLDWYFGGNQSNPDLAFYNSNWVNYHPASLEPNAISFLYGDVAMASLDTPAADVPTWAMMFSPLPAPTEIGDGGTGYHVDITGYGRNGNGTDGSYNGIDFRRRAADNMLGALASLDQFEEFLFGAGSGVLPQNVYWIDFDDPLRGTIDASPFDFNAWRDEATENEGITAGGDSGGPLILDDTYDIEVIIGVLSGGYSAFFLGQPANSYGVASFYQPLYLYWDWIAANNPYTYASAVEGDGAWEDPEHWVTTLDPNYMVLDAEGNLVNGIPDMPGEGPNGTDGSFGQACFQSGATDECFDMATGEYLVDGEPVTTGAAGNSAATVTLASLSPELVAEAGEDGDVAAAMVPPATLANGLPGATGFVPDNNEGDPANGVKPTYYDITLTASGTTTLSSDVTIDRFAIDGAGAALDITADGSLTSLMSINQYQGMMRVDGALATNGDYMLMTGGLQGSGTITTPYFTNVAGVIAPGGVGEIGTLTFNGNVTLSSGSTYLVDLGPGGASDLIQVNAQGTDDGMIMLGGMVGFAATDMLREGDTFTIVSAENEVLGEFDMAGPLSAILSPELTYTPTGVEVELEAGLYADVVAPGAPVQGAYAQLLDQNRPLYDQFAGLYGPMDMMWADEIQATLDSWAPREQPLLQSMVTAALDTNSRFIRERIITVTDGNQGGSLTYYGSPAGALSTMDTSNTMTDPSVAQGGTPNTVVEDALPEDMSAFIAGGYIDGKSDGAPTAVPYAGDKFHGYYIAAGLEKALGTDGFAGMAVSYTMMKGDPGYPTRSAEGDLFQISLYAGTRSESGFGFDAQVSGGMYDLNTSRMVSAGMNDWTLENDDTPFTLTGEVGVSQIMGMGAGVELTPRVAFRYAIVDFGRNRETGGGPALEYEMDDYKSAQGRAGLRLSSGFGTIKPFVDATYVHDFQGKPGYFGANFVGGIGPDVYFALPGDDQDWGEIGVGITTTGKVAFSLSAETTVWRTDLKYQSYRGAITVKF